MQLRVGMRRRSLRLLPQRQRPPVEQIRSEKLGVVRCCQRWLVLLASSRGKAISISVVVCEVGMFTQWACHWVCAYGWHGVSVVEVLAGFGVSVASWDNARVVFGWGSFFLPMLMFPTGTCAVSCATLPIRLRRHVCKSTWLCIVLLLLGKTQRVGGLAAHSRAAARVWTLS